MTAWKEKRVIGDATLYLGDCFDILPTMQKVDAVITDPPYGIGLDYELHNDSIDWVKENGHSIVSQSMLIAPLVSLTSGVLNVCFYPMPTWSLCWFNRSGAGRSPWGSSCWQPILVYGKDYSISKGCKPDFIEHNEVSEKNGHPCPKPIKFMRRWIDRVSNGSSVCDPLMGSGTTGVACMNLRRKFIGIEIDPKYFEIACERIENAQRQASLLDDYDTVTQSYEQGKLL